MSKSLLPVSFSTNVLKSSDSESVYSSCLLHALPLGREWLTLMRISCMCHFISRRRALHGRIAHSWSDMVCLYSLSLLRATTQSILKTALTSLLLRGPCIFACPNPVFVFSAFILICVSSYFNSLLTLMFYPHSLFPISKFGYTFIELSWFWFFLQWHTIIILYGFFKKLLLLLFYV